jgi:hypothetical protein
MREPSPVVVHASGSYRDRTRAAVDRRAVNIRRRDFRGRRSCGGQSMAADVVIGEDGRRLFNTHYREGVG